MRTRPEVFDTYWEFAAERQRIFYRRLAGQRAPWTADPILAKHRFCNAYRASDRVSQYLIRHIIYGEHLSRKPEDIVFRILLFRFFNQTETWDLLETLYGDPRLDNFDVDRWYRDMDTGMGLFGAAYMLCGVKVFGYDKKHGNYLALVRKMVDDGVVGKILNARSLEEIYRTLHQYPLVGEFLAYQILTDLNYSDVVNFDDNSFTMAGPGAVRGIDKVFEDREGRSYEYAIQWMRERQAAEFEKRGVPLSIAWLWGHPLQAIDIQNLFCETDKYSRVKFPELGSPKRIKQGFQSSPAPLPGLWYPPKWGVNELLHEIPKVDPVSPEDPEDDWLSDFM